MEFNNILFELEDNIATITFNRPKVLNAMNMETALELANAIAACKENEKIKVIILTGAGDKAFVAGADINEFRNKKPSEIMKFTEAGHSALRIMETMGKPTIAAVNGYALGGGVEISMACDVRFASETARFGQPEILLGLIPGWGGTQRLARLIGIGRAKEFIISGEQIPAQRAYEMGLVNRIFPAEQLMNEARKFAQKLAGLPSFAIKMAQYAINYGYDLPLDNANSLEIQCMSQCFSTQDLEEGVAAFLEKRKPHFIGK
ncbi:MAG: enoyl-CoA hydratase/isomerase family protein [Chloroflexi bacterium]|nr:enoyl-CoA hydratase/isomerase family protein [Chloroflexota bacterium]MCK4262649.1 enoyl-CoA hydratase/isomerase family protein [Dehalococcoidia bacterium]